MIWLLSKAGRIESDKWTANPSELAYYCSEGDKTWQKVTPEICIKYCKRKEKQKKPSKRSKKTDERHDRLTRGVSND